MFSNSEFCIKCGEKRKGKSLQESKEKKICVKPLFPILFLTACLFKVISSHKVKRCTEIFIQFSFLNKLCYFFPLWVFFKVKLICLYISNKKKKLTVNMYFTECSISIVSTIISDKNIHHCIFEITAVSNI